MHVWKTLKIFISSTFKDLELERDKLAFVFQELQERVFERQLHLVPYDLRWQEAEKDLVGWCLGLVKQSQYFIAILNNRYGWRPPYDIEGKENIQKLSITEMEINQALQTIPKEKRFFCFTNTQNDQESTADQESVEKLKQKLKGLGERVFEYNNTTEMIQIISHELGTLLDRDYPPQKKVFESHSYKEVLKEIIDEKRKGFVGRNEYLEQLQDFCQSLEEKNYLVIHATAGTGKSALLAHFLHQWQNNSSNVLLAHFASMSGDSHTTKGVLQSLAEQLQSLDLITEIETLPELLLIQVHNTLQKIEKQMVLAIDGLDEMEPEAKKLLWLPRKLPSCIRVILTTRPVDPWEKLQEYSLLELGHLQDQEIRKIIGSYREKLKLTAEDEDLLCKRAAGNPLFLKVALDEMMAGGVAVGQLAQTVEALFRQILTRLQNTFGQKLIDNYLGWIAASSGGISEAELREIFLEQSDIKKENVLLRIQKALANFIICREKLLNFFHPEFERLVKSLLGKAGMRNNHQQLAAYFDKKGFSYQRTLEELPYQLQWGEEYKKLLKLLSNLEFLQAKCTNKMIVGLRQDFKLAIEPGPVKVPNDLQVSISENIFVSSDSLLLIGRALETDIQFLAHHPQCLLQCLWNRCYWHDCPQIKEFYNEQRFPMQDKIYLLAEHWDQKSQKTFLKSQRPLPKRLDSPLLKIFRGHQDEITGVCTSPDHNKIISCSGDATIRIWDIASGQEIYKLSEHQDVVRCVCCTRNKIISGSDDETIKVWDLESGKNILTIEGHSDSITTIAHSDNKIISGSKDGSIRGWSMLTGECLFVLRGRNSAVTSICVNPDGTRIASSASDNTIRLWEIADKNCIVISYETTIESVIWSEDGQKVISGAENGYIDIWDAKTGDNILSFKAHNATVDDLWTNQDATKLISVSWDNTVKIWDGTGKHLFTFTGHENWITSLDIVGENQVVSGSYDKTLRLWELATHQQYTLKEHEQIVESIHIGKNSQTIACGSRDNKISLWDTSNGKVQSFLSGHQDWVECVAISNDGTKIVSSSDDRTVKLWDIKTGECLQTFEGHEGMVWCVCISEDGSKIASGASDETVRVWDAATGKCLLVLKGHNDHITSVCLSPKGKRVASGGSYNDKSLRVWDTENGQCLFTLQGHTSAIDSISIVDKNHVVTSSIDQTVKLWDVPGEECIKTYAGRGDTRQLALAAQEFPHYVLAQNLETIVYKKEDDSPIAFWPDLLEQATIRGDVIVGKVANYVYILKMQEK